MKFLPKRLNRRQVLILALLCSQKGTWVYGLDLIYCSQERLSRGRLYVDTSDLEEMGLIQGEQVPGGPERGFIQRRRFMITDWGYTVITDPEGWRKFVEDH